MEPTGIRGVVSMLKNRSTAANVGSETDCDNDAKSASVH